MMKGLIIGFICLLSAINFAQAQNFKDCTAELTGDTLFISNSKIIQKFLWNEGDIKAFSLTDKETGKIIDFFGKYSMFEAKEHHFVKNESLIIVAAEKSILKPEHLSVEIINEYEGLMVRNVYTIFPDVPALTNQLSLKYETLKLGEGSTDAGVDGTENFTFKEDVGIRTAYLGLSHPHFKFKAVQFKDITDGADNLVFETDFMPYRRSDKYKGNLLIATDQIQNQSYFILKEAPNETSQINYPGFDFAISNNSIVVPVSGFNTRSDISSWVYGYLTTIGVAANNYLSTLSIKNYLKNSINYSIDSHEMVLMNTWGDRSADGRLSEKFILKELDAAKEFGVSHFQIDDGWQAGYSKNSVNKSQNLWDLWSPKDWEVNPTRFPNGLESVVEKAKQHNIELGLWFHPSSHNNYERWETDAKVIVNIYKKYGIKYIKIDGMKIPTNDAHANLGRFFEKVKKETNGEVFFNLDLTAGVRGGYFSYRYSGNLFLENRYTDWVNYYPYRTLRNLWKLSKYYPVEMLQIEFLNNSRNHKKYGDGNLFAPGNYSFEYIFATTMAGQPLAWFEATGLPKEAFAISEIVKKYRGIQADFHAGMIVPIGDEPSGRSWTGFQSQKNNSKDGYLIVYRENNPSHQTEIVLPLIEEGTYDFEIISGKGKVINANVDANQKVSVEIPEENAYLLVKYKKK